MTIKTKFKIGDKVKIKKLKRKGVITGISIDSNGIMYRTRHFDHALTQTIYFFDWELE